MKRFFSLLFFLLCFFSAVAQQNFEGFVKDQFNNPLRSVSVSTQSNTGLAITDSSGYFVFQQSAQQLDVIVSSVGFTTQKATLRKGVIASIILHSDSSFLEETIVRAFEYNRTINNTAASVSVLNKTALDRYGNQTFVAAVNTVAGVKMDERSPGSYRLSIRGNLLRSTFGVRNVKVYWNGIPFTDANGNTYFNQLSLAGIDRVEIIKGPSGSMYGAGTGGVVLLSTAADAEIKKEFVVGTSTGSYGLFSADLAYKQNSKNQHAVSFSHVQSNGYRVQSNMRRDVANYNASIRLNSLHVLKANVFYSDLYYQTPGGLTKAEMLVNPSQARPAAGVFNGAEAQRAAIYLKTFYAGLADEIKWNAHWKNTTGIYFSYTGFKNPTIRNYEDKYERGLGTRTVFQYLGKIAIHSFGGEYQQGFINTGVFGNRLGIKDTLQYNDAIKARQYNIFFQSEINVVKNIVLTAGVSYNNFYYGFSRLNNLPQAKEQSNFTPQFIPRIALLLKTTPFNFYLAVSKGYSPPSIDEVHASDGIFNRELKAETGWNYEVGIKGDLIKNKLWMDVSYYIFGLHNTIVSRRDASGADFYVNAGKTNQRGLETSFNFLPVNKNEGLIRRLKFWANYTNLYARFKNYQQGLNKFDGNKLTGTPPNVFVTGVDVASSSGLYTSATYSYTDRIPLNDANSFYATAYNLFYSKLGYKVWIKNTVQADFFAGYERSFNRPYSLGNDLNATGNRFYNPSAPHNFYVGAKFNVNVK